MQLYLRGRHGLRKAEDFHFKGITFFGVAQPVATELLKALGIGARPSAHLPGMVLANEWQKLVTLRGIPMFSIERRKQLEWDSLWQSGEEESDFPPACCGVLRLSFHGCNYGVSLQRDEDKPERLEIRVELPTREPNLKLEQLLRPLQFELEDLRIRSTVDPDEYHQGDSLRIENTALGVEDILLYTVLPRSW